MPNQDEFLVELYDALYDTPAQRKFKRIRPMPVGVVYIQWPGQEWDDMREHLRLMKQLGYTCLKGIMMLPGYDQKRLMHMALDEGIIPWWYGEAGWEAISDELLDRLGIPRDTPIQDLRVNAAFLAHQEAVMRARIDRGPAPRVRGERDPGGDPQGRWVFRAGPELKSRDVRIEDEVAEREFTAWLQEKYGSLDALKEAWNAGHAGLSGHDWQTWEQAVAQVRPGVNDRGYNRLKDVIRWKTTVFSRQTRERVDAELAHNPHAPVRAGGEISVFLPVTGRGIDMEAVAELLADRGSLYPSTHPAWHFDTVEYEQTRTIYMYSSFMADALKGGWSATWESTGGPQQISGGKGWSAFADTALPAYTVDAGVMAQMTLTYLAAGYRGFGFWCWSARTAGREGGEYSLLDRNNQPGERAIQTGAIGQAARRLRDELWQAHKEPLVGVLIDQENDIQWSIMADFGRDLFAEVPIQARVGVSRALINANVPWEYVTAKNLRQGLADRYRVIYLPAMLALDGEVFEILTGYVERGGRLVLDMPGAYFDELARITDTGAGSPFEKLFGVTIDDYQYASNVPRSLDGQRLEGFVVDMTVTQARLLAQYDRVRPDGRRRPAIAENAYGQGTAVILGYEASLMCARPGNEQGEAHLVRDTLGSYRSPYACDGAIVYRLAAPEADHYFLINDGPATSVLLDTGDYDYSSVADPVSGEALALGAPVALEAYSGRWLRYVKRTTDDE